MKNLIYKELKLSINILCYLFVTVFCTLFTLTPGVGPSVSFIYCLVSFSILLLGPSKGKSTNDLYYSLLLPIRKKDIVKGKMFSFVFLEILSVIFIFLGCLLYYLLLQKGQKSSRYGLSFETFGLLAGIGVVGYGIVNIIFFSMYFKEGKAVNAPTIISVIVMLLFMMGLGVAVPFYLMGNQKEFWDKITVPYIQTIFAAICLVIYCILNFVAYKIAVKRFERADQ